MKSKIKKIVLCIKLFFILTASKVFAISPSELPSDKLLQTAYGIEVRPLKKNFNIGVPIILFIIGLFVIISKKITKKVKIIVILILIMLGILDLIILSIYYW